MTLIVPKGSAQVIFPTETGYYIHVDTNEISSYFNDTITSDIKQGDTIGVYGCVKLQNHQFFFNDAVSMLLNKNGEVYRKDGTIVKRIKIKSKKRRVKVMGTNGIIITQVLDKREGKVILTKKEWDGIPN